MTRGEEGQGADTENSERPAATTPACYIDIVYFNENSLKIIQNVLEIRWAQSTWPTPKWAHEDGCICRLLSAKNPKDAINLLQYSC